MFVFFVSEFPLVFFSLATFFGPPTKGWAGIWANDPKYDGEYEPLEVAGVGKARSQSAGELGRSLEAP